jgi:CheY-like chemotaxis protein
VAGAGRGVTARILVVEDEPLVRLVAVDSLVDAGFQVEEAGSATEALAKLNAGRIDAAVIDIGLPDRGGDVLADELRAQRAGLAIVIASGHSLPTLRQRFAGDSRVVCLGKPYDPDELIAALRTLGIAAP